MTKRAQQTLGIRAAQASASARRRGKPDPLDSAEQITPTLLAGLGVTEARQLRELASDYRQWSGTCVWWVSLRLPCRQRSKFCTLIPSLLSDGKLPICTLTVAQLYWKQKRFGKSSLAAIHAVVVRPVVAGRPLKPVLRRLGLL